MPFKDVGIHSLGVCTFSLSLCVMGWQYVPCCTLLKPLVLEVSIRLKVGDGLKLGNSAICISIKDYPIVHAHACTHTHTHILTSINVHTNAEYLEHR